MAAIVTLSAPSPSTAGERQSRKFYSDDPLWREPAPRPVKQVATRRVDDIYDFLENSYATPRREGKQAKLNPSRALDINTLGEVPDNGWYTNRHAFHRMSIADLQRGPGNTTPPSTGAWTIVGAKSDGVTPGFIIQDKNKNRYLLKLDPPQSPEMCSAADVIGSKFFYALGYFTPENYIVHFHREDLAIPPGATWRDSSGRKHPLTRKAVDDLLRTQSKERGGTYRALASRWVEGEVVGPFSYRGTRSDDPNDTIPHQDRRVLRGLGVFAAWLNHHDTRSINSMDTLVGEGSRRYLKHYLIDFGSILGSAGYEQKEPWMGHQYALARPEAAVQALTLGLYLPRWMRTDYPKLRGVGLLDSWAFDPLTWKPNYPNPAFLLMDREDAFWAAKQVASFSDEEIRAIVETGELSDPRASAWIAECLIKRRDKIAAAWFPRVLPLHNFHIADGRLAFDDLQAKAETGARRGYQVIWSSYDNDRASATPLPAPSGTAVPAGSATEYMAATISCASRAEGPCANPVTVYLRRTGGSYRVVGVER